MTSPVSTPREAEVIALRQAHSESPRLLQSLRRIKAWARPVLPIRIGERPPFHRVSGAAAAFSHRRAVGKVVHDLRAAAPPAPA